MRMLSLLRDRTEGERAVGEIFSARIATSRFDAGLGVEIARRFVGKNHCQRAGDGHPLLFPAGELVGQVIRLIRQADNLQRFVGALPLLFLAKRRAV